jgi:hypothetical protein
MFQGKKLEYNLSFHSSQEIKLKTRKSTNKNQVRAHEYIHGTLLTILVLLIRTIIDTNIS